VSAGTIARIRCPAKVNLFLEVLERRPDGFHEIETVLLAIALHDTVEILPAAAGVSVEVVGADLPAGEGNLVHRAALAFLDGHARGAGAGIRLTKRIPIAAGLGGGSSDAAGTLLGLRDLFRPDLDPAALAPLAAEIGSDVPFFLHGGAAVGRGRGEALEAIDAPPASWIVLHTPDFGLSTAEVYRQVRVPIPEERRDPGALLLAMATGGLPAAAPLAFNRLEAAAARVEPRIPALRESLARDLREDESLLLSGSGSTFFAVVGGAGRAADLARRWNVERTGRSLAVATPA